MARTKTYKNDVSASLHELASDLREVGLIDKATIRRFDESCLTPAHEFTADETRRHPSVLQRQHGLKSFGDL